MKFATIHRPSAATIAMVKRKIYDLEFRDAFEKMPVESIGICQGTVLEIIVASDIAEKTADVTAFEINGSCPQHMTCLAIIGKTSAVMAAVETVERQIKERMYG